MAKNKKEEKQEDFLWIWDLMLLALLLPEKKEPKVINIYMGDE